MSDDMKNSYRFILCLLFLCGGIIHFTGCAGDRAADPLPAPVPTEPEAKPAPPDEKQTDPEKRSIDQTEISASPNAPQQEPALVKETQPPPKKLPSQKIFLDMKDVPLTALLRTLARAAEISIMVSENVKGNATLNVQNEAWDQVFLSVLKTYGLSFEWQGNIVQVLTLEDISNDYRYLELNERREAKKREIESIAPLVSEVIPIRFADAESLRTIIDQLLAANLGGKRGTVVVEPHTNSLIVKATGREIDQVASLIRRLDRPAAQIRIEAHIVEAGDDTARELGVEWGGLYQGSLGASNYWITPGIDTAANANTGDGTTNNPLAEITDNVAPAPGLMQTLPSVLNEDAGLLVGFVAQEAGKYVLGIQLAALEREGKLNILSSPSISTLDNQTALIESGREVPYQTVVDDEVNIEFKKAVLSLVVTPHVIDNQLLKLKIITNKDELDFSNNVDGNPTVITKKAETTVLLADGQTTVIGGLRKENSTETTQGVPYLKDIPYIGHIFRKDSKTDTMEELLIFITPRIIRNISGIPTSMVNPESSFGIAESAPGSASPRQ